MNALIENLAANGVSSIKIADAVQLLFRRAFELGEVEEIRVTGPNLKTRMVKIPRRDLLGRLAVAAERGAFRRYEAAAIVDRILSTEAPR